MLLLTTYFEKLDLMKYILNNYVFMKIKFDQKVESEATAGDRSNIDNTNVLMNDADITGGAESHHSDDTSDFQNCESDQKVG